MKSNKLLTYLTLLALLLAGLVPAALAQGPTPPPQKPAAPPQPNASLGTDPKAGIESLGGSFVAFDSSVGGDTCYMPGVAQTFCFRAESYSPDWEYVYNLWQRFPTDWTVNNVYVTGTPYCDQGGSFGAFAWSFQTSPYEVNINHPRYQANNPAEHCVAYYCFEVTSGTGTPDALESWYWDGDGWGNPPHNPCSNDNYTPAGQAACDEATQAQAAVPPCVLPPIVLTPENIEVDGCPFQPQEHVLTVWNNAGYDTNVNLTYQIITGTGTCNGPAQLFLTNGANMTFTVGLDPQGSPGDTVVCQVYAEDAAAPANNDTSWITKHLVAAITYWEQIATEPDNGRMDNVLAGYNNLIWSITGYGGNANVRTYDPTANGWTTVAGSAPSFGVNYARSGCHPFNSSAANKVFVYGDAATAGFTGLWSYDMNNNLWTNETPGGTPPVQTGIWAPAWVYDPDTQLCYMTGGATASGGGDLTTVYVYDPVNNAWLAPLPNFTTPRAFHAAFMYNGMVCVMGGVDASSTVYASTQCYNGTAWNAENADIPALPTPWWGMGYAPKLHAGTDLQLWLVNGVDAAFNLIPTTAYYDVNAGGWVDFGPLASGTFYRTAAVNLNGDIYHVGGSTGGFAYSGLADHHVQIICPPPGAFTAWKEAPVQAMSGDVITYSITIQAPAVVPGLYMSDTLPAGVAYAGNLTYTAGLAWYDPGDNAVYWTVPPLRTAAPAPARPTVYDPDAVADLVGGPEPAAPAAPEGTVTLWASPDAVLWDNGPLVTHPGNCGGQDASRLQTSLGMNTLGFGHQLLNGNRMADDFEITNPDGWLIDQITFFAYQTGAPSDPSPITGVYYQIWDGPPDNSASQVVFGNLTANRLLSSTFSGIQRDSESSPCANNRYIFADVASAGVFLPPGTYWLDWMTDGTLSSGPWAPPITLLGQTTTGNALQYTTSSGAWGPANDSGTLTQQGMPFIIEGTIPGGGQEVTITFNVTVTAYCSETILNEGVAGDGSTVVTFTAETGVLGEPDIEVVPPALGAELCPDSTETQDLLICNVGTCDLEWELREITRTAILGPATPFVPVKVTGDGNNPALTAASPAAPPVAVPAAAPEDVLWDQPLSSVNQAAYVDQDFGDYPTYSSFLADDFVNADAWTINSIFIPGDGWNGFTTLMNATSLTWQIYADDGTGFPDGDPSGGGNLPVWTLTLPPNDPQVVVTNGTGGLPSNTQLNLATPIVVPPGHWWLVFYPTMDFGVGGQYGRQPADTLNGYVGKFINPGGAFGFGTAWQDWTVLGVTQQDIAFRLEGTAVPPVDIPWLSESPTTGTVPPGECQTVTVTFDATGLTPGDYLAGLVIQSNDPDEPEVTVPVFMTVLEPVNNADFTWTPVTPTVGAAVTFSGTVVSGTEPLAYAWAFGDGGTGSGQVVTHTYAAAGDYTVVLTVSNACGVAVMTHTVTVACEPVHDVDFSWAPITPTVGVTVTFTGTAQGTEPFTYAWAFGDGGTGSGAVATHAYAAAGDYTVVLTVTNCIDAYEVMTQTVTVEPGKKYYYLPIIVRNYTP